ncbi:dipeptide ABC transporter ATP-binding protein [Devosia sp.]|uniref:dipeptide ABC transporter ATP-binding protein n=1 Tax=Devosia sp. TaxID=1871048 RepID=UPI002EF00D64
MTEGMLEVRALAVAIGNRPVVSEVNFTLPRGQTLAIIGESGSGKSMTAAAIMGLLPAGLRLASHSEVLLGGKPLPLRDESLMRRIRGRRMAMIFQDPMSCLNPYMTVGAQIAEALRHLGVRRGAEQRERIVELLRLVELPTPEVMVRRYPHQMSGGQQQRVMIAMALASEPELLIADEPTSALDATVQAEVLQLLERVQQRLHTSILFITHDLAAAARLAHDIVVLQSGRVVEQGPVGQVIHAPRQAYTKLLVSVRQMLERPQAGHDRPSERPVLVIRDLSYAYPARGPLKKSNKVLDGISLPLHGGRTLGILGESGSGKSTLALIVAGLISPDMGEIELFGDSMAAVRFRMSPRQRRRCQIVFQNPYGALNPRLTIEQTMREPIELLETPGRTGLRSRLEQSLADVGLEPGHLNRYPHQLSGGQRQRVCIARALLSGPELLICDEIVSALDATVQMQVLETVRSLQRRLGFAMLFIGHDIEIVRWVSDDIAVMHRGRVVELGNAEQIVQAPAHSYTRRLIASAPALARASVNPGA